MLRAPEPRPLLPGDDAVGSQYDFDSTVTFPGADAVEAVYRHGANGSDHLWVTAAAPKSALGPQVPPELGQQPAESERPWSYAGELPTTGR